MKYPTATQALLTDEGRRDAHVLASRKRRSTKRRTSALVFTLLLICSIFALGPILWILMMSFKMPADIIAWPPKFIFTPVLDNYVTVLTGPEFLEPFANSLIVTLSSLFLTLIIGLPASYALARLSFRGKEDIAFGLLSLRFAPELLVVLPLYLIYQSTGLQDSYIGLILAYQLVTLPMFVWMMRSFIEDLPPELEEAVAIDGGTRWTAFRYVILRLITPGLMASLVLAFVWGWNNYTLPLVLSGRNTQTITTGLQQYIAYQSIEWGPMAAATVISILPGLLIAVLALRFVIDGLTAGTVKG